MEPIRRDIFDLCVSLIESRFGEQKTYDELLQRLSTEFPELNFTIDDIISFYSIVREQNELQILYNNLGYG